MIVSQSRRQDLWALTIALEVLETAIKWYKETASEAYVTHIEYWNGECDRLQNDVKHFDYTERDMQRKRVDALLKRWNDIDKQ